MITSICNLFCFPSDATVDDLLLFSTKWNSVECNTPVRVRSNGAVHGAFNPAKSGNGNADPRPHIYSQRIIQDQGYCREFTGGTSFRTIQTSLQRAGMDSTQRSAQGPLLPRCACSSARNRIYPSSKSAASGREKAPRGNHRAICAEADGNIESARYRNGVIPGCQWDRRSRSRKVVERVCRALPLLGIWGAGGTAHQIFCDSHRPAHRLSFLRRSGVAASWFRKSASSVCNCDS